MTEVLEAAVVVGAGESMVGVSSFGFEEI